MNKSVRLVIIKTCENYEEAGINYYKIMNRAAKSETMFVDYVELLIGAKIPGD